MVDALCELRDDGKGTSPQVILWLENLKIEKLFEKYEKINFWWLLEKTGVNFEQNFKNILKKM